MEVKRSDHLMESHTGQGTVALIALASVLVFLLLPFATAASCDERQGTVTMSGAELVLQQEPDFPEAWESESEKSFVRDDFEVLGWWLAGLVAGVAAAIVVVVWVTLRQTRWTGRVFLAVVVLLSLAALPVCALSLQNEPEAGAVLIPAAILVAYWQPLRWHWVEESLHPDIYWLSVVPAGLLVLATLLVLVATGGPASE